MKTTTRLALAPLRSGATPKPQNVLSLLTGLFLLSLALPLHAFQNKVGDQGAAGRTIAGLHNIRVVASTIDPTNGDQNPYGLVVVPKNAATTGKLMPGDLLVSNINNANNVMGLGTTIELIQPSAAHPSPATFFNGAASPIAMVLNANATNVWIANYGLEQNGLQGDVQVINNMGVPFAHGNITAPQLQGSWGQGFNGQALGGTVPPAFFDTNVLTGAVYRLQKFILTPQGPNFAGATITRIAQLGHAGHTILNVVGPQGMAWSKMDDTLYIADPVNNRIVAVPHSTTTTNGYFYTVYHGRPLNQPAGIALNPLNGDLLIVNQGDNKMIELALSAHDADGGHVVGVRLLDKTKVQAGGVGSALFGVAATVDPAGKLEVYFTNDNTNTVNLLSAGDFDGGDTE